MPKKKFLRVIIFFWRQWRSRVRFTCRLHRMAPAFSASLWFHFSSHVSLSEERRPKCFECNFLARRRRFGGPCTSSLQASCGWRTVMLISNSRQSPIWSRLRPCGFHLKWNKDDLNLSRRNQKQSLDLLPHILVLLQKKKKLFRKRTYILCTEGRWDVSGRWRGSGSSSLPSPLCRKKEKPMN